MKHSLPCRALRKRPYETRHYRHSDGQRRFVFGARCGPSDLFFANQQHDARRAGSIKRWRWLARWRTPAIREG